MLASLIVSMLDNWGERSEPHTCGENGKLTICLYGTCVIRISILPYLFTMQYFHIHVASRSCSKDETRKTERLNSQGNQRNTDLKNGEEKGGTISKTVTEYLTVCFVTLPPTGSRPSISVQSGYSL